MSKKYTVAIAGGGLLGRLLAWRLAEQGLRVALFEQSSRNVEQSAAFVAAAMLAPMAEAVDTSQLVVNLAYQSLEKWSQWIPTLAQPVFLQQNGSLIVWHAQDQNLATAFQQRLQQTHATQTWQHWQNSDIQRYEPQLQGRFKHGLFLPNEGQLDNRQVLSALAQTLEEMGVACFYQTPVEQLENLKQHAEWVIDCRGIGAKNDWNMAQSTHHSTALSRLRGVRGEVARIYSPEVQLNRPVRLLHPRYPLYICPKENNLFVIGATQLESEDTSPMSVRSSLELFSALYAVCPAFGEARILEINSSLRPTLSHEDPEIRYHTQQQLISVNGLFRHGFMIAPAVCEAVQRQLNLLINQQHLNEIDDMSGIQVVKM